MRTPSARREVLVLVAGIVWSAVGLALIGVAIGWLTASHRNVIIFTAVGIICGAIVYRYGFSRLVEKNLARIYDQAPGKDKICIFAFQNTRSYILLMIMMVMGYTLRHLPIPKVDLAPAYIAIGLGLFLASIGYYKRLRY